jgi:hypothetical protein
MTKSYRGPRAPRVNSSWRAMWSVHRTPRCSHDHTPPGRCPPTRRSYHGTTSEVRARLADAGGVRGVGKNG